VLAGLISGIGPGTNPGRGAKLCQVNSGTYAIINILGSQLSPGSWFLVHPASKTHWATRFLKLLLSSAASSTSSQLMPTVTKQYKFGTSASWEGNRRSGVALAMRHTQ